MNNQSSISICFEEGLGVLQGHLLHQHDLANAIYTVCLVSFAALGHLTELEIDKKKIQQYKFILYSDIVIMVHEVTGLHNHCILSL